MLYEISKSVLGADVAGGRPASLRDAPRGAQPSNEEIVNASKQAYSQYQPAVDATALALANLINTGSQAQAITKMDGLNWTSPGITADVAEPIFASPDVQGAIGVARRFLDMNSCSVGVFSNSLPNNAVGMIGFDRNLAGSTTSGIQLTLDLFKNVVSTNPGSNLQLGVWLGAAGTTHDIVLGLYINVDVQNVPVNLKILLSNALAPYGFVVSSGAVVNLPLKTGVFGGATAVWE